MGIIHLVTHATLNLLSVVERLRVQQLLPTNAWWALKLRVRGGSIDTRTGTLSSSVYAFVGHNKEGLENLNVFLDLLDGSQR